jgi:PadR family transcriptional regulator AphA
MSLEHILLGMLREPASGYDIRTAFNEGGRYFWSAELSQIYPTLQKMEKQGWLKSHREPSPKGPDRRIYRRTAKGTAELRRWLLSDPVMGTERFAYIAQLIFMGEVDNLQHSRKFLTALRERLRAFHELLESAESGLRQTHANFPNDLTAIELHEYISLRIGVHSLKAKVAACEEGLELINARLAKETSHV